MTGGCCLPLGRIFPVKSQVGWLARLNYAILFSMQSVRSRTRRGKTPINGGTTYRPRARPREGESNFTIYFD